MIKIELSARTHQIKGKGKCKFATLVTIYLGDLVVARATLGGKASPEDALREFNRFPSRFTKAEGYEMAKACRLCA